MGPRRGARRVAWRHRRMHAHTYARSAISWVGCEARGAAAHSFGRALYCIDNTCSICASACILQNIACTCTDPVDTCPLACGEAHVRSCAPWRGAPCFCGCGRLPFLLYFTLCGPRPCLRCTCTTATAPGCSSTYNSRSHHLYLEHWQSKCIGGGYVVATFRLSCRLLAAFHRLDY